MIGYNYSQKDTMQISLSNHLTRKLVWVLATHALMTDVIKEAHVAQEVILDQVPYINYLMQF